MFDGLLDAAMGAVSGVGLSILGLAVGFVTYRRAKDQMGGSVFFGLRPTERLKFRRRVAREYQRDLNAMRRREREHERMGINPAAKPSGYTTRFWDDLGKH